MRFGDGAAFPPHGSGNGAPVHLRRVLLSGPLLPQRQRLRMSRDVFVPLPLFFHGTHCVFQHARRSIKALAGRSLQKSEKSWRLGGQSGDDWNVPIEEMGAKEGVMMYNVRRLPTTPEWPAAASGKPC